MPTPFKLSADKSLASHLAHCPRKALRPWEASPAPLCWQMMITLGTERGCWHASVINMWPSVWKEDYFRNIEGDWVYNRFFYWQIFTPDENLLTVILHNNYARLRWWIIPSLKEVKPVLKELFTASTGSWCIGSIVGWHVCFISCYGPFFQIWPLATSQRQWSEVSTPRHNNLSGKNISLMLQSYIVWDDSESERGLLFGRLCSAAALLWNGGVDFLPHGYF